MGNVDRAIDDFGALYAPRTIVEVGASVWDIKMVYRLWAYVMAQAICDLQLRASRTTATENGKSHNAENIRCREEACKWFFDWDSDYVGSLAFICHLFDLDVEVVRQQAMVLYLAAEKGKKRRMTLYQAIERCKEILYSSKREEELEDEVAA